MNKVNSFSSLINKIILKRFKSYIFLIFAVILSVFFSSTLVLVGVGTYTSIIDTQKRQYGNYDIILSNENIDDLVEMNVFSQYGTTQAIGYAMPDEQNIKNGFTIAQYDNSYISIANKELIEGSYPTVQGEIAIEKTMLKRLGSDIKIGDTITLTIAVPDGKEFLNVYYEKEYVLTGILHDQYVYYMRDRAPNPVYGDIPAALVSSNENIEAGGMYITKQYGVFESSTSSYKILAELNNDENSAFYRVLTDSSTILLFNTHGLDYSLMNSDSYQMMATAVLVSILAIVLIFMTGFTIVSAFYSNLDSRVEQIGLLRVVGATKRQIKRILLQEIIIVSVISVPIGIILSFTSVNAFQEFIGEMFVIKVNIPVIIAIILFSLACIMLSSQIALRKASQIPPMQVIRNSNFTQALKKRRVRTKNNYNVPMHIAKRKIVLHRNNVKPLTILISLTVIILTFAIGFGQPYLEIYKQNNYDYDFNMMILDFFNMDKIISYDYHSPGISESDRQTVEEVIGNGAVYANRSVTANIDCVLSDYMLSVIGYHNMQNPDSHYNDRYQYYKGYFGFASDFTTVGITGVDDAMIKDLVPYVYEGEINLEKISSGEEVIIIIPEKCGVIFKDAGNYSVHTIIQDDVEYDAVYKNDSIHAGDTLNITMLYTDDSSSDLMMFDMNESLISDFEKMHNTVTVGALVQLDSTSNYPFVSFRPISLVTSNDGFETLGYYSSYRSLFCKLDYIPDSSETEYIEQTFSDIVSMTDNAVFTSFVSINESNKRMASNVIATVITLFVIFVVLSICVINNSLSASIHSSKAMIGTVRAVGATKAIVRNIFAYQLFDMIKNGVIIGIIVFTATFFASNTTILSDIQYYFISVGAAVVYIVVLYCICYLNIHNKTNKYLKSSIVENIREL